MCKGSKDMAGVTIGDRTQGTEMEKGTDVPGKGHSMGKGVLAGKTWDMQGSCAVGCSRA